MSVRNFQSYDVIKLLTLSIKFHNLGGDLLAKETNDKITLSDAEVCLDRDWDIPPTISAPNTNSRKSVVKVGTKKTYSTLLKDQSDLR